MKAEETGKSVYFYLVASEESSFRLSTTPIKHQKVLKVLCCLESELEEDVLLEVGWDEIIYVKFTDRQNVWINITKIRYAVIKTSSLCMTHISCNMS